MLRCLLLLTALLIALLIALLTTIICSAAMLAQSVWPVASGRSPWGAQVNMLACPPPLPHPPEQCIFESTVDQHDRIEHVIIFTM